VAGRSSPAWNKSIVCGTPLLRITSGRVVEDDAGAVARNEVEFEQRQPDGRTFAHLSAHEWKCQPDDVKTQGSGAKWLLVPFGDGKLVAEVVIVPATPLALNALHFRSERIDS